METIAFLGSSRGLGRAAVEIFDLRSSQASFLLVSRAKTQLEELASQLSRSTEVFPFDLSKTDELEALIKKLEENEVRRIFYFAGGGPFGLFHEKAWKDHMWGINVSFLSPLKLILACLSRRELNLVKQFICIGSQLADSQADPFSASYAGAKHGLKGAVESIIAEKHPLDLRLFRPGYMDTSMLPKNATPRVQGESIVKPEDAAKVFYDWSQDLSGPKIFELSV
jgi:short-subunit dehydrogenase